MMTDKIIGTKGVEWMLNAQKRNRTRWRKTDTRSSASH